MSAHKKHKQVLQGKPTDSYLQRSRDTRDERPRFLIVCEGKCTEPYYFIALKNELRVSVDIKIEGLGDNTDSLVERAMELKQSDDFDQVWVVFDRDSFPAGRFNRAIQLAESNGIQVAYSNEAFELWYVLHFEYLQVGLPRKDYVHKLNSYLKRAYQKNSKTMYTDLKAHMDTARRHAAKLLAIYPKPNPEQDNPSTKVHLLIEELLKNSPP